MPFFSKLVLTIFISIAIGIAISIITGKPTKVIFTDLRQEFGLQKKPKVIESIIEKAIDGQDGEYAFYIEDMIDGEQFGLNHEASFKTGSLYKLLLLAATLRAIEDGRLKMDTVISSNKTHLKEVFGGVDFGYEEAAEDISYTVEEAINRIATNSDNFAAITLTEKVRGSLVSGDALQSQANDLGLENTYFGDDLPTTTAKDIGIFFKKLYRGEVVSQASSEKIIDVLSKSRINNRIPALLPGEIEEKIGTDSAKKIALKIAHKTAELPRLRHDAGIVFLSNRPYIIVMMSKELKYEDDGIELLAKISKDVFEYFNTKN
ncbi:hypothetical protein A2688_03610 [Candidatus Daviesbacteria bacterium RIFCSPHIGHO2_01_FULL_38_8]|nr:MAG: hypothetical protein A2688_03610 [Candidatus Daviesbacteria bacterium RIFCSPHIGHO2_01_FULL_38_8]